MLYVYIRPSTQLTEQHVQEVLHAHDFIYFDGLYRNQDTNLGDIFIKPTDDRLIVRFSDHENFPRYKMIHQMLVQLIVELEATYDDSNAFMGYLKDGSSSHILTNWQAWADFILGAKHTSMINQKVKVFTENYQPLTEGLLVDFTSTDEPFRITSCTLITQEGEQLIEQDGLVLEATGEFM